MPTEQSYTDKDLRKALIKADGQPTKAAEILGVTYISVYGRIRKNPELLEIQKASRAKTFNDLSNISKMIAVAGIIREPVTNKDGKVIKGEFQDMKVDYRIRVNVIQNLMNTFKSDDGIVDKQEITITDGEITGFRLSDE